MDLKMGLDKYISLMVRNLVVLLEMTKLMVMGLFTKKMEILLMLCGTKIRESFKQATGICIKKDRNIFYMFDILRIN